jgi:hypothetical protein
MGGMKDLLGDEQPSFDRGWSDTTQEQEIERVTSRIGSTVLAFVLGIGVGGTFHAEDLRRYVGDRAPGAPGSPDRILRDLRTRGFFDYAVERAESRYTVTFINHERTT